MGHVRHEPPSLKVNRSPDPGELSECRSLFLRVDLRPATLAPAGGLLEAWMYPVSWISLVQSLSRVPLFETPWTAACQASLSITNSQSLLKLMSIESVMPSNHLILCHPLLLPSSIFSSIRVFSNESDVRIRWPKYWSFSFNISPSNAYSGLFPLGWIGWISLQSKGLPRVSNNTVQKHHSLALRFLYSPSLTSIHDYWKNHSLD